MSNLAEQIDQTLNESYDDDMLSVEAAIDLIKTPGATLWVQIRPNEDVNPIWVKAVQRDVISQLKKMKSNNQTSDESKVEASLVRGDVYLGL